MLGPEMPEIVYLGVRMPGALPFRRVQEVSSVSELDAYQFVTQNARAPIVQMVDPEYTVLVKIGKKRLPKPVPAR